MSDHVHFAIRDGVATVTLNRPDRRNAIDVPAMRLLADNLGALATRADVRCVVLRGSGGAFCAGADLPDADLELPGRENNVAMLTAVEEVVTTLAGFPAPVLAQVEGPAAGVGASIAFACDLVFAARTAFFLLPFTGIGLVPDGGATLTVAASMGRARAMRMALLGERLPATTAFDAGLVSEVCAPEDLAQRIDEVAVLLASGPTRALGHTKAAINASTLGGFGEALARETAAQLPLLEGADYREGVLAFREGRRPIFTDQREPDDAAP